jgi:hypothetical protein
MITEEDFDALFKPLEQSAHGDVMAPQYRDAFEFAKTKGLSTDSVWAIIEGEDGSLVAAPGPHVVNVVGFIVTEIPWKTGYEMGVYSEADFSDDLDIDDGPGL